MYSNESIVDICKCLVDAEFIDNPSSLANCDNIHLLRSDLIHMSLIHVLHPRVILFMLPIGFIYFGIYFLSDVSPIHTLPSTVLVQKNLPGKLLMSYHCVALVLKFEVDAYVSLQ